MSDQQMWQIVAFIVQLESLSPAEYATKMAESGSAPLPTPDDPLATSTIDGAVALQQYGCISCHRISGLVAANHDVGPSLHNLRQQAFIAGRLPNTRDNLVHWIRFPQQVDPRSAMPDLNVTESHAQAMVDYLYGLQGQ